MTILNNKRRIDLGRLSRETKGDVKGAIEPFGLYTPQVQLS